MPEIPNSHLIQRIEALQDITGESFIMFEVSENEDTEVLYELYDTLMRIFNDSSTRILITPGHIVETVHVLDLEEMLALRESLDQAIVAKISTAAEA